VKQRLFLGALAVLISAVGFGPVILTPIAEAQNPEWAECKRAEIMVTTNRIHIRCAADVNGIIFFGYPTSDTANVDRYLHLLTDPYHGTFNILYDPGDTSGTAFGCQAHNCRKILGMAIQG
jgi:hypothetical protein